MSDAQLPPDTGDEESAPPLRWGTHLNDAGVLVAVRLDASDDAAPQDAPISLPDADRGGSERERTRCSSVADVHAPANETASDDFQPMLDLRLPDPLAPAPLARRGADPSTSRAAPTNPHAAASSDAPITASGQQRHHRRRHGCCRHAMEISPIFSALDAAERAAQACAARRHRPGAGRVRHRHPAPTLTGRPTAKKKPSRRQTTCKQQSRLRSSRVKLTRIRMPASRSRLWPHLRRRRRKSSRRPTRSKRRFRPRRWRMMPPPELRQKPTPPPQPSRTSSACSCTGSPSPTSRAHQIRRKPDRELTEPPPIPAYRPAVQLPVTPPPMIAAPVAATALSYFEDDDTPPRRRWGSPLGSFFAGFALSWVFGAVLYVYLTAG